MCRLLAFAARGPRAVTELLTPEEFTSFCELSRLHRDGWGIAWRDGRNGARGPRDPSAEVPVAGARSVISAAEDPQFEPFCRARLGTAGFVHLRWATGGLPIAAENTHPFLLDGWAFGHQGEILPLERVDDLTSPRWRERRRGTTDSERFFLYVLECIEREHDAVAGTRAAAAGILSACGNASLNSVLLSRSSLLVVHGRSGFASPRDDVLAAVARPEDVPPDHLDEAYFGLRYRCGTDSVVISSSGVLGGDWRPLRENSILHIDLESLVSTVHDLHHERASRDPSLSRSLPVPDA